MWTGKGSLATGEAGCESHCVFHRCLLDTGVTGREDSPLPWWSTDFPRETQVTSGHWCSVNAVQGRLLEDGFLASGMGDAALTWEWGLWEQTRAEFAEDEAAR